MKSWKYNRPWYHGSPLKLKMLHKGSTITQNKDLARIFSHKPTLVSASKKQIKHNGSKSGFLYKISESIKPNDVFLHPHTSMKKGEEWLTNRELRVELIGTIKIIEEEKLSEEEILNLRNIIQSRKKKPRSNPSP